MALNGLITMTPSSVATAGTGSSATINTNGSVTFTSCDTISLNGVFNATYITYMLSLRLNNNASDNIVQFRMRSLGSDYSVASSYASQQLNPASTGFNATRTTTSYGLVIWGMSTGKSGTTGYFYGPYLNGPTGFRFAGTDALVSISQYAGRHTTSAICDGISFLSGGGNISGVVTVYAFNE